MKKSRIILSVIVALIFCLQAAFMSFAASTTLYFSENEVDLGDTVTVTVKFSGDDIAGVEFNIDYDSSVLTYKSSSGSGSTSYNGGKTVSYLENGSTDSYSVSFVFTANGKGSSQISVNGVKVSDGNGNAVGGFDGASAKLSVVSEEKTTEKQTEKATEKTSEKATEKANEEETEKQEKKGEITLNGKTYILAEDSALVEAPDGFDETYSDYKGNRILTYTSKDKSQQIVCLIDENGKKSFALFDDEKDTFSEFISVESNKLSLILTPAGEGIIPDGFTPVNIKIGENEIVAYENAEFKANGIYLVYGIGSDGKAGLYIYDSKDGTIQRYLDIFSAEDETTTQSAAEEVTQPTDESKIPLKTETMIKIICAVSVLLLASLIAVVTLAVKLKRTVSPKEEVYEDEYTEDEEKFDE